MAVHSKHEKYLRMAFGACSLGLNLVRWSGCRRALTALMGPWRGPMRQCAINGTPYVMALPKEVGTRFSMNARKGRDDKIVSARPRRAFVIKEALTASFAPTLLDVERPPCAGPWNGMPP